MVDTSFDGVLGAAGAEAATQSDRTQLECRLYRGAIGPVNTRFTIIYRWPANSTETDMF